MSITSKIQLLAKLTVAIAAMCCVITACKKDEDDFSDIPRIEFRSITQSETGIDITTYFEDGNGDISQFELTPILLGNGQEYAIFNDTIREDFVLANEDTAIFGCYKIYYYYNINEIAPVSANGSIKGTITCNLDANEVQFFMSIFPENKKKFRIILYDRAGNESNMVKTSELINN